MKISISHVLAVVAALVLLAIYAYAQDAGTNYRDEGGTNWVIGGTLDSTTGKIFLVNGATPPATCTVGELFLDTDETVDTNCTTTLDNSICACSPANTWLSTE